MTISYLSLLFAVFALTIALADTIKYYKTDDDAKKSDLMSNMIIYYIFGGVLLLASLVQHYGIFGIGQGKVYKY